MLNNTDDDDNNRKLPPIPPYCEQPSQAKGVLDENGYRFRPRTLWGWLTTTEAPNAKTCTMTRDISYSVVWQAARWTKRCCSFIMLVVTRKKCWTDIKTPPRPSPTQRKYEIYDCCLLHEYLAQNDAGSLPMQEDGPKGRHNPMHSASIIMKFLTNWHNCKCYTGTHEHKKPKAFYENKLVRQIAAAGIKNQE